MGFELSESPNWRSIIHLANCPSQNSPTDSFDESYFLSGGQSRETAVEFYEFATHARKVLTTFDKPYSVGIALAPDRRYLLYSAVDRASSNLMLVDGFR